MPMPLARLLAMRETRPLDFPSRVLAADPAIVLVAGQDALLFTTAGVITLTADAAVVEVAGQDAALRQTVHVLPADGAVVEVEGQDATLAFTQPGTTTMVAEHAVVEVAGQDADLARSITLTADVAVVEVAGQDATLSQTLHVLQADAAVVEVAGQDAALVAPAAAFELEQEVFADFDTSTGSWTKNVTFDGTENLVVVAFASGTREPDTVVLDPGGAAISLSLIAHAGAFSDTVELWGVYDFSPQTGVKQIAADFSPFSEEGGMAVWTFRGAGRLPTTGDFDTDTANQLDSSMAGSLTIQQGETGIILAGASLSGASNITAAGGLTEVHEHDTGSVGAWFARNSSPSGAETPGVTWSGNATGSFAALKVVAA